MADAAFQGAGKAVGLELWRVENLQVVKQEKATGKFHVGDSYILLSTTQTKSGALRYAIHFWLGSESSQDETGIAAYKTVELDDALGSGPVQYREVQNYESNLFLSYFKNTGGVEYLPGGVGSGFHKVERDVYPTRLLHLKGRRTVRVTEVPIHVNQLNSGDVFILDAGLKIYLFYGMTSNKFEKTKGIEVAENINADERGSRAELIFVHENPQDASFWNYFGGYVDPNTLPEGASDAVADSPLTRKLFRISDSTGTLQFDEVSPMDGVATSTKFSKAQLESNDVFLLQSSQGKIYLWIGRSSTIAEKREATVRAVQYIKSNGLPAGTPIERVSEGTESAAFKSEFVVWDAPRSFGLGPKTTDSASSEDNSAAAVAALLAMKKVEDTPVDDGSGKLTVWSVKDFKKHEEKVANYGEFFGGDSYILLYNYFIGNSRVEHSIIYFWLGADSTADEKGAAALLTVELDDSMGGKAVQVRVTQGKEPAHFRQLFKGKMVVYKGGYSSGEGQSEQSDVALFHIKGTNAVNTVAVEVNAHASSLNSEDSFVLITPTSSFVWIGLSANEDEQTVATNVATTLAGKYKGTGGRAVVVLKEGNESEEFWAALGGKSEYPSLSPGEAPPKEARLFAASTATGTFKVEEVDNFAQSDLNDEDVFLLDTYTQLYVWLGSQSTPQEKEKAYAFAAQYVAQADDGRPHDIPIIKIVAGREPPMFTCHFLGWDNEYHTKHSFTDPYQAKLNSMAATKKSSAAPTVALKQTPAPTAAAPVVVQSPAAKVTLNHTPSKPVAATPVAEAAPAEASGSITPAAVIYATPVPGSWSHDDLKAGLPQGVDPANKEEYLDDASFKTLFDVDRAAFRAQPKWKRDAAKKKVGLF